MHYKNGREAKEGDRVVDLETGTVGVLHSVTTQSVTCNGRLAPTTPIDPWVTLSNCVHVDDIKKNAASLPDASKAE